MHAKRGRLLAGFTLIELLIVIAIIAILALIAIPNFMLAQMRAKVARVQADMKTIATALESYTVDNGTYLYGEREWQCWTPRFMGLDPDGAVAANLCYHQMWARLTTPIAYLTQVPDEPFTLTDDKDWNPRTGSSDRYYRYNSARIATSDSSLNSTYYDATVQTCFNNGITWYLFSYGPFRKQSPVPGRGVSWYACAAKVPSNASSTRYPDLLYDPTNGAQSFGHIMRTNKGELH